MFAYYLKLALRSFRRNKVLTALMVLAVALGIGASMTTLTVFHVLSGDPIPHKSDILFYPRIEPRTMGRNARPEAEPMEQMTRFDAEELLRQKRGVRQALMTGGSITILPDGAAMQPSSQPFRARARYASADFFPMFDAPLLHGRSWSAGEDEGRARVAVISRELSQQLFDDANGVGRSVRLSQGAFQVIGVLDDWAVNPRFYDLSNRHFGGSEQIFLPFSTAMDLELPTQGSMWCWGNPNQNGESQHSPSAPCAWVQYWVELATPDEAAGYLKYLSEYSDQQRAAGRFERPANVRLDNVMGWLDFKGVVPRDVRMQMWLAFGFLLVCLVNTTGLLLAKFLRRSGEVGVRRALGASRHDIFTQCLMETGCIGAAGGVLGLGFALLGLWLVRQQPDNYAQMAHMNPTMLGTTLVLALAASLMSGLLPAWRAMQITPAVQLKTQ